MSTTCRPLVQENRRAEGHDLINRLPTDCIKQVFSFLQSSGDRCSSAAVCKKWLQLQADMTISVFQSPLEQGLAEDSPPPQPLYRHLQGRQANDIRLAALAVGTYPLHYLTCLYVWEIPSPSSSHPYHRIGITDDGLKTIAQASPYLRSLTLRDCQFIGNEGIKSVAKCCGELEKLELINSSLVDDNGLTPIAERCLNLSTLSLVLCPCIGNQAIMAFANNSLQLKSISLIKCPLIGDTDIVFLISNQPKLTRIKFVSMKIGDSVLKAIREHGRALEVFYLEKSLCPAYKGYSWVEAATKLESPTPRPSGSLTSSRLASLKKVDVRRFGLLTDRILIELSKSAKLVKKLKLKKCRGFTVGGLMETLSNWSHSLKELSLKKCIIIEKLEQKQEQASEKYPSLTTLKLKQCEGVDDCLLSWMGLACKRVKQIHLIGLESITDRGLLALLRLNAYHQLETLDLSDCTGIGDLAFCAVIQSSGMWLKSLGLEGCTGLSNRSLATIAEQCPVLDYLIASWCRISDDGVCRLVSGCRRSLVLLSLAGCTGITDNSLRCIEMVSFGLQGLNLMDCPRLSRRAIDSLENNLPRCNLIID